MEITWTKPLSIVKGLGMLYIMLAALALLIFAVSFAVNYVLPGKGDYIKMPLRGLVG